MPHRVLVVDDQLVQREYLRGLLKRAGALHVETADGGAQALAMLYSNDFDLVLSDVLMPDIDGIQFIQKLSQRTPLPMLAIISSSPRRLIEGVCSVAESLGVQVVDQISKPATFGAVHSLLKRVRTLGVAHAQSRTAESSYDGKVLAKAIATRQIQAWYQPQLRIADGLVVAAEALVRWVRPNGNVLLPVQFLPSMIAAGLEEDLLMAVVEHSIEAQALWLSKGCSIEVSVNLPSHLLDDQALPDRLHAHVVKLGGAPERLCFELTETSTTRSRSDFFAGVCRLRIMGFGVSQDDAGQGYSSIFNIASAPFTEIKIDRSLVARCARDDGARAAVESIVGIGRKLSLNVVAEGVETHEQLAILKGLKCDVVQGFLISRALNNGLFCDFVLSWNAKRVGAAS